MVLHKHAHAHVCAGIHMYIWWGEVKIKVLERHTFNSGRGRQICVSLRTAWATQCVLEQTGICSEILSQNKQTNRQTDRQKGVLFRVAIVVFC